ncbi:hypothetical protein PPYR_11462 [Photinus pyralis]|uniref:DUF5641 domain-containing protein n=1 Tax=Photinus pyralis TaxID=7054 RepID=A0A5N4ABC7_PHOPY|nr:hypothetical protein PPYR_11462 [Photinus pyralis]
MWSRDYLNLLQNRPKWKTSESNLLVGDLVLVREDHLPPLEWCLARILEVMPGRDNKVRVVKLKTVNGEFTRPFGNTHLFGCSGQSWACKAEINW